MGNNPSALETCLSNVCGSRTGCVSFPSDPLYQINWVKPYNLAVDVTPLAVVRPNTAQEVSGIVKCASTAGVKVQAKSGGHSYANFGLGGGEDDLVAIDMVNFQQFSIDNTTWHATIGPGTKLGSVDDKLHAAGGRAFAHGICPGVGVGGHATIGGLGPMSRMWGAALDHVVEVEVVTADGSIVRASDQQNSDLFFALKGAGAGFGVITEFVFRTHPEPGDVVQYSYSFTFGNGEDLAKAYKLWQDVITDPDLDRRFGTELVIYPLGVIITGTFYGTKEEFETSGILDRLPQNGNGSLVITDWLGSLTEWAEHEALYLSDTPTAFYSKSLAFKPEDALSDQGAVDLFNYVESADKGTLLWFIIFDASGGAVSDVPMNATAYAHRDKVMFYQSYAIGLLEVSDSTRAFLTNFHNQLLKAAPADVYGTYPGYVDPAVADGAAQAEYWMTNLPALETIKQKWDSADLFHNPQSVRPATS